MGLKKTTITVFLILFIGSCAIIELALQGDVEPIPEEDIFGDGAILEVPETPIVQASSDFSAMVRRVERMRQSRLANMSETELMNLGEPVLVAARNSIKLKSELLEEIGQELEKLSAVARSGDNTEHSQISRQVQQQLNRQSASAEPRHFTVEGLRQVLLYINQGDKTEACRLLFNTTDSFVLIYPGELLNGANEVCRDGSVFVLMPGIHEGHKIESSRDGNQWIGLEGAVIDGKNEVNRAFNDGLDKNVVAFLEIRNYTDHGFHSMRSRNLLINRVTFRNIAPEKHGQEHGAVMFQYSSNIEVKNSHFENVASSVRFRNSSGPLRVVENSALNSGRNFFQCDKCDGGGIRINRNSMEQTEQYGIVPLEDWINLYMSNGTESDWIQVNENRARGYGDSDSGSFIMLGDDGGSFQEAKGNIGINPGQVGIGIAGGTNITVEGNLMYSEQWEHSNVAYYSAEYASPCGEHKFTPGTNKAHWISSSGRLHRSWADGNCGVSNEEIRRDVVDDRQITPAIWQQW